MVKKLQEVPKFYSLTEVSDQLRKQEDELSEARAFLMERTIKTKNPLDVPIYRWSGTDRGHMYLDQQGANAYLGREGIEPLEEEIPQKSWYTLLDLTHILSVTRAHLFTLNDAGAIPLQSVRLTKIPRSHLVAWFGFSRLVNTTLLNSRLHSISDIATALDLTEDAVQAEVDAGNLVPATESHMTMDKIIYRKELLEWLDSCREGQRVVKTAKE